MRARVVTNRMTKGEGKSTGRGLLNLQLRWVKRKAVSGCLLCGSYVQYCFKLSLSQGMDFIIASPSYPAGWSPHSTFWCPLRLLPVGIHILLLLVHTLSNYSFLQCRNMTGTHYLLAYDEDDTLLVENIYNIKSNTDPLLVAIKNLLKLAVTLRSTRFNIQQFYMVLTLRLCILYGFQNKLQLLPYRSSTDLFIYIYTYIYARLIVFTARYALSPNIKQITFHLYKVSGVKTEVNSEKPLVYYKVSVLLGCDAASLGKSLDISM